MNLSESLINLLEEKRVEFRRHGEDHHVSKQSWIGLRCPWCGGDQFHFGINIHTGRTNCWQCGKRRAEEAIAKICRVHVSEIYKLFGQSRAYIPEEDKPQYDLEVPKGIAACVKAHRSYLTRRGYNADEIERIWEIQGIGIAARLQWRLYIPIHNRNGKVVSWTTRSIADTAKQRYISASVEQEEVNHKSLLYGSHLARHAVIVVEGPTDAWAVGPGAVATFGISYTKDQAAALSKFPVRIICYDAADNAQSQAERLCKSLQVFDGVTENVVLETGSDPADANADEIVELRSKYL